MEIEENGIILTTTPNSTRFKEAVLAESDGLEAFNYGRDVVLIFKQDIGVHFDTWWSLYSLN